jgi:hypothetical protein
MAKSHVSGPLYSTGGFIAGQDPSGLSTLTTTTNAYFIEGYASYAASGTTYATCTTNITTQTAYVNSGTGGVILPAAQPGLEITVVNTTSAAIVAYPYEAATTVNGNAQATGVNVISNEVAIFVCPSAGVWVAEVGVGYSGSYFTESSNNGLAAAGTNQATAALITTQTVRVSTSTAGSAFGVQLPLAAPGLELAIVNDTPNGVQLYASASGTDTLNDTTGSTGITLMPNSMVIASATGTGKWYVTGIGTGFSPSGVNIETASYTDAITASGTTSATATALSTQINRVTTNSGTPAGVTLPVAKPGLSIQVTNATGNSLIIYGNGSDDIQTGGSAAASTLTVTTLKTASLWCASAGHWHGVVA